MDEEMLAKRVGTTVRRLRLERGHSQASFAQLCRLERAYMGIVERGEVNISVRTAFKIARGLGLDLTAFFCEVERLPKVPSTFR